jgi:16S rRNA (guanine966-N2)-methyltransferase
MAGRLRVVAGQAGGLHLVAPPNARPTTERAREALFSALGDSVRGAVVMDLFAGSGAMGIEALSRGAERAVFVDGDREARQACVRNLATTRFTDRARVVGSTVQRFLEGRRAGSADVDLVFCDPPYEVPDAEVVAVLDALRASGCLAEGAVVVVERRGPAWDPPDGWSTSWQRKYGDTLMTILHISD